jgi:hypothetical protein
MERDVYEPVSQSGFTFSTPFFYTGLTFSGLPEYVDCADKLDSLFGRCRSVRACVIEGTTHQDLLEDLLPGAFVVPTTSNQ